MKEEILAKRYSRALFSIGLEQGGNAYKTFGEELYTLKKILDDHPTLLKIFRNPVIKAEDKKSIVKQMTEKLGCSKIVQNFCFLLGDKDRLGFFPSIQRYYNKILDQEEGLLRGKVVTAIELSSQKKDDIKKGLEQKFAQNLILEHETNNSILGGLVLQVGDKVYDASLKAQLDQLKENIKKG